MIRFRIFLPLVAALFGVAILGAPPPAHAAFAIRVTEFDKTGAFQASSVVTSVSGPGVTLTATFNLANLNALPNFTVNVVTNTSTTGTGFSRHDTTVNFTYVGPLKTSTLGSGSDKLLVEVLGDSYFNPTATDPSQIVSTGSASTTRTGVRLDDITMTSGVIAGNVALNVVGGGSTPANLPLGSQLGMTTATGDLNASLPSAVLGGSVTFSPDPAVGSIFPIANPFTFYQTYLIENIRRGGTGGITAGTEVDAVTPAPAGLLLALSGLPILGGYGWLRRRKAVQTAKLQSQLAN